MSTPEDRTGGRPKGLPKTGGRKKGPPNRATVSLREKLAALGYDPMIEMVRMSRERETPPEVQVKIHLGIASYLYPKRKPVDELIDEAMIINVITNLDDDDDSG